MSFFFRRLLSCGALLFVLAFSSTRTVRADIVRRFDSVVRLRADSTLDVTDSIAMDFGTKPRHGIYRTFMTKAVAAGKTRKVTLRILSATDAQGKALKYVQSQQKAKMLIKFGDPNVLVRGLQIYRIHYLVDGAIMFYRGVPLIDWNVTGSQWPTIQNATARFYPPPKMSLKKLLSIGYRGVSGSLNKAQTRVKKDHVLFSTTNLRPGEGLTFLVALPKTMFRQRP